MIALLGSAVGFCPVCDIRRFDELCIVQLLWLAFARLYVNAVREVRDAAVCLCVACSYIAGPQIAMCVPAC